jgi:hypothetical protein
MSGSFTTISGELARYKIDLVSVQKVRWGKGGTVRAGNSIFFYRKGNNQLRREIIFKPQNNQQMRE